MRMNVIWQDPQCLHLKLPGCQHWTKWEERGEELASPGRWWRMRCWWPHVLLIMNLLSPGKPDPELGPRVNNVAGLGLNCWTGLESEEDPARWKQCDLKRGFRTCYTKYDPCELLLYTEFSDFSGKRKWKPKTGDFTWASPISVGQLAGRGCSSKEKLYREHCEVHEMDGMIERFCYCSFNLCNTSTPITAVSHSIYHIVTSNKLLQPHSPLLNNYCCLLSWKDKNCRIFKSFAPSGKV